MSIVATIKELLDIAKGINNMELNRKLVDLQSQVDILFEENKKQRETVRELETKLAFSAKLTFKDPFYFAEGDDTPYCAHCWQKDKLAIYLVNRAGKGPVKTYKCTSCKNEYKNPNYEAPTLEGVVPVHRRGIRLGGR